MEPKQSIPPILRPESVKPISLSELANRFDLLFKAEQASIVVTGISMNTGDLRPGDLFVAMPGKKTHGANFVTKAIELGAVAVITDSVGKELLG